MTQDRDRSDLDGLLRRALQARVEQVRIAPDALSRIRVRTRTTRRRRRSWTVGLASFATAAAAAAVAVLLSVGGASPPPVAIPPATQLPAQVARLPIYYVAQVGGVPVLYREFHPAPPDESLPDRIRSAVAIMLAGQPFDPDYRTDWPATISLAGVTTQPATGAGAGTGRGGFAVVDLSGAMPTGTAGATALQQLVYTVTAVAADRGVQLEGVVVRHDGRAWSDAPLTRAPALETLAPVWLISPQEGDAVGATFDVHIAGFLGAELRLRLRGAAGEQVSDQAVTIAATTAPGSSGPSAGSVTPSRGETHVSLRLPAGRYTVEAYVASAGQPGAVDNHTITVAPAPAGGSSGSGG